MTNMPTIGHRLGYTVLTSDIGQQKNMTLPAFVRQLQEAAMQNVMNLKVSVWDMQEQQLSWVLLRKKLDLKRLPKLGEKVTIETYPAGFEKVFTYRDFKVFDETGALLATSATTWLLLHTQTRRMVRIPDFILRFSPQIPPAEDCLPRASLSIPAMGMAENAVAFRAGWHDLDFNGHLNNVFYIQWMLEALPDKLLEKGKFRGLEIQFKVEAHWRDTVRSEVQCPTETSYLHRLVKQPGGKELASAVSKWG